MPFLLALCCLLGGHVAASGGAPIAGAHIEVRGPQTRAARSDAAGNFHLQVAPGRYELRAWATGFSPTAAGPFAVDRPEHVAVTMQPLDTPELRVIGSVRVDGKLALQRDAVPNAIITRSDLDALGFSRVVEGLAELPSVTFARPDGGSDTAPTLVALRGPDPSETLIALDGQILNDANTGDLDLSRFPVAAFSSLSVTEGLGPSDTEGSNTIGGAVNIISLQPTRHAHTGFSVSGGSFGRSEVWYNATGSQGKLGYAGALDDQNEHGYVDQNVLLNGSPFHLGSALASRAVLLNTRWSFSQSSDLGLRIFSLGNARDESGALDVPADASNEGPGAAFTGPGAATFSQSVRSYLLDGRSPLGSGTLAYGLSDSDNNVNFAGTGVSPYDVTHRDRRDNLSLSWERPSAFSSFAAGGYLREESLTQDGVNGALKQSIASTFVRESLHATQRLNLQGGVFYSQYSTFGGNLDGRIGADYNIGTDGVVRASVGTGFRAPLLIERYLVPVDQLPLDQNCVATGQGDPNERPEHATEYELGYGRTFGDVANVDISLYRTNLRDPIEVYYPLNAACPAQSPPLQSFPINVGNAVYQGGELRYTRRFSHLLLTADYGVNIAYPRNLPPTVSNPTSGGSLVDDEQFLNIPQQQASLGLSWQNGDWHAGLDSSFRGKNNELNQGPYALLNAAVGRRIGHLDLTLAVSNLTDAVAGKFTLARMGLPYEGVAGPLPTDRYFVEPTAFRLIGTFRT